MKSFRRIAARGLTPEHRGAGFGEGGYIYGTIAYFEHFGDSTVVGAWGVNSDVLTEYDYRHLDEIEVHN